VKKCKPLKKIAETDAIFNEVHRVNKEADESPKKLRISLDTRLEALVEVVIIDKMSKVLIMILGLSKN